MEYSPEISQCAGKLRGRFRLQGITRSPADRLIAAIAQIHQLTLVTRNTRDFEGCEIPLFNPFLGGQDCAADGATYQEAVQNAEIIVQEWIETAQSLGRPIPEPKGRLLFV